jgi:ABC-2 type transport system ATP-binding protein
MQKRIRGFLADYNRRTGATILLTSHYMADVEALCKRVVVIHHGRMLFDGALAALSTRFAAQRTLVIELAHAADLAAYGEVVGTEADGTIVTLRVERARTAAVTARLLAEQTIVDLTVEDTPIEDVIEMVFASGDDVPVAAP